MTSEDYLVRHFSRLGARVRLDVDVSLWAKIWIDVGRDRAGEFFNLRRQPGVVPEILDVQPARRHLLMVRDDGRKNKFLLGHDERHWFVAAVPGDNVHDVRSAIESLRPAEADGRRAVRQGEWFFIADPGVSAKSAVIYRNEPLSRGAGSKPHFCEELMRRGGVTVMVCSKYPPGVPLAKYENIIAADPKAQRWIWRRMTRDAGVWVRGAVRHRDHKTVHLDGWHSVYLNRERFAPHARHVAFLD